MDFDANEGVDRISDLPNHILCHILSFLPTKYAVGTSVLSTRWRYLWTSVPVFNFDGRLHGGFNSIFNMNVFLESEITFRNVVNRVMLLNSIPNIQKFRLVYDCHYNAAPIFTWLQVGISHCILELNLDFCLSVLMELMMLPKNFFMRCTLVVLKLSRMPLIVPSFVSFPKLKVLEIRRMVYLDD
uniref:F-box domain-containing protein n=1 Tax=Chenopodium quinoa TaxID=63459 RepID=A0A803N599_CHEQI